MVMPTFDPNYIITHNAGKGCIGMHVHWWDMYTGENPIIMHMYWAWIVLGQIDALVHRVVYMCTL